MGLYNGAKTRKGKNTRVAVLWTASVSISRYCLTCSLHYVVQNRCNDGRTVYYLFTLVVGRYEITKVEKGAVNTLREK